MSLSNSGRTQFARSCSVSIERAGDTAFIWPAGELDLSCEDTFRAEVASMAAWCPSTVIVELREVTFIDLHGLRLLLALHAGAREDGFELTLVGANRQVQKVLRITRLDGLLPLERALGSPNKESAS